MATTTIDGTTWRVSPRGVARREGSRWRAVSRAELRALPVDGEAWQWLRAQGVARPSPSGPGGAESRRTVQVLLRLPPETAERLRELAGEGGVSAWVAAAVARHR